MKNNETSAMQVIEHESPLYEQTTKADSSYGIENVMQGKSSHEVLKDWQVTRKKEFTKRNIDFKECDKENSGSLESHLEQECYANKPRTGERFR